MSDVQRLVAYAWTFGLIFLVGGQVFIFLVRRWHGPPPRKINLFVVAYSSLYYGMGVAVAIYTVMELISGSLLSFR